MTDPRFEQPIVLGGQGRESGELVTTALVCLAFLAIGIGVLWTMLT